MNVICLLNIQTECSKCNTDFVLLLPAQCITAEPVSSTRRQIVCNVLKL